MIKLPDKCLRDMTTCKPLSQIEATDHSSFFCVGENDGTGREIPDDKYTICFKNCACDERSFNNKRDLTHNASVLIQALAIIEELA